MKCRIVFLLILACLSLKLLAQEATTTIYGKITDPEGKPVFSASVTVSGTPRGTVTDENGYYELIIPSEGKVVITFSCLGYDQLNYTVNASSGSRIEINRTLRISSK
jgi:iron complex outermembrane receptor protein